MSRSVPYLGPDERQLILNCARVEMDGPLIGRTGEILRKRLDWEAILLFAEAHSVASLIHRHVEQIDDSGLIPPEARRRLLQLAHRTDYRNRQYSKALHHLLGVFAEGGVPVIVLKGLSLVELVYGDFGLRPLIDLNLLIPRDKLEAARNLLLQRGWVEVQKTRSPFYRSLHSQIILVKPGEFEVLLLLQWGVVNWPRIHAIDLHRFWEEAQPVRLSGRDTLIPSPVDLVLYLCLQSEKHGYLNIPNVHTEDPAGFIFDERMDNRLIRFTDIYETIKHYQRTIDWEVLIERARDGGVEGSVYTNLCWITKSLGPVVEPRVLESLRPPRPRRLRRWLFEEITEETDYRRSGTRAWFGGWWLKKHKRLQRRLIDFLDLLEFAFPRRDELRLRYGLDSKKAASAIYLLHTGKGLFLGAGYFLPWAYRVLGSRTHRLLKPWVPPQVSHRLRSYLGAGRS
jgi:hypothetical protein